MSSVEQHLQRWLGAGVIDSAAAAAIREFEGESAPAPARPTVVEALVYLAVAAISAGFMVLVAVTWEDLATPVRVALPAAATAVLLFAGGAMRMREHPGLQRAAGVAWLATVAAAATTGAVAAIEAGGDGAWASTVAAAVALGFSIALWSAARTDFQVLALAGSAVLASLAAAAMLSENGNEDYSALGFGVTLTLLAALGILAIESGALTPALSARAMAAAALVLGTLYCAVAPEPAGTELAAFFIGAAAAFLSLARGVFVYMAVAVLCAFIGLSAVIMRHVDDPTVAALAFIASGIALLVAVIVLERWRPWQRGDHLPPGAGRSLGHI